jgi:hypothetical protein
LNIFAFSLGCLLHITFKVLGYVGARKDQTVASYFRGYTPLIIKGAIGDVLIYAAWAAGLLPWLVSLSGVTLPTLPDIPEQAGFALYLFGGFFSDSAGKTFVSSLERLFASVARRFGAEGV